MNELKGTNIAATIVPYTGDDTYPTHDSHYGLGGYKEVPTLAQRDSIPSARLREGCKVYVVSENKEYVYKGNGEWTQSNAFLPTGETGDGTKIQTFDDLIGLMLDLSGGGDKVQRNVRILNNLDSKNISASKGEPCYLEFTFISQERYSINDPYENTGERGFCEISIKNTLNAEYVVVKQMYISSGQRLKLDIAEYLTSGANNVMIKVTGEVTEVTTPSFVYTVQLTSLSISANNFKWWTAYTGDILFPLNIGGNISKNLFVTVTGNDYIQSYEIPLGTNIYVETAYNYSIPHPNATGIFKVTAYVANADGSIRTRTVTFNIICAVTGSQDKLIAINHLSDKVTNWSENTLFEYAMYDGDNVSTSAIFIITKDDEEIFNSTENSISTSTKYSFSLPLEIETIDSQDFSIVAAINSDNTPLTTPFTFLVNNSLGYSAVSGTTLYITPKTRSNRQENRQSMINEVDGSPIEATWTRVNWGNDCWVTDNQGNKVLRLLAGSDITIRHSPFKKECARTGKTFEIDYLISNVTDFSKPAITLSTPIGDSFIGLNIYPDDIIMYTQSLKNKDVQSLHTFEEKRTRLTLTIMPDAYGNSGFNLCILYVNGIKNREFTYENNDYFAHNGEIIIGSNYADVDIYGIREYDSALTSQGVQTNYVNWLSDTDEKATFKTENDILDANGSEIDFENTLDQYNVLVYDNTIPSLADQTSRIGTLQVYYYDHPEWNVSISNVTAKGQGTSSMKYWIWNTRYQLDKTLSVITHADGSTSKKVWQMIPGIPAGQKFTAKKNFASSMQSHKIGAVNSYTDLYRKVGLTNEAMQTEKYSDARVSVYELPFFCFEKSINDEGQPIYTFRGLYTFGPDKGDKYCFGHDTDIFPGLIAIEGSDNSPLLTLFRVPWNPDNGRVAYNEDEEAFQYNGANSWDFGAGEVTNINRWIPTYNHVYSCSPRLKPFNGTVQELNAQASVMRTQPYEYWIAKADDANRYDVYYFEASEGRFIPSDTGEGTINLVAQLCDKGYGLTSSDLTGKTNDELNTLFINARIAKFRKEAPQYWDIDDCLFFINNVEFNAGTDERAKNTYPYCFGTETSKWRWRVDDADTRFDTTNRGLPDKSYSVETHDADENGASVWNGETNNFFNLMELAFPEEKAISMRKMMVAMQELGGLKSGNDLEKIYAFYHKYYFTQAQEYFPANGYNADAKYCYENGKLAYISGIYSNDTDPITQSLGDHYLAEQRWITKRILYMMAKYNFGLFSASGTDTITVRAAGNTIKYRLTPAMDLYPAISNGTSIIKGNRTESGEICEMEIELSGSGDQQNAIQGASYLQDIGDWYDKNVTGSMVIQGKMLREIRLGSKTEPITISISSLTISNCVSLQKLVLSNIRTLSGALSLLACTHLKEVHAGGTALSQIKLPAGGGLELVEYSSQNQYVTLSNYPLLTNEGVKIDLCKSIITDFFIVDCPQMEPIKMLVDIMNAQQSQGATHALRRIRAVGFDETYRTSEMLDKLAELSNGSYEGLSSEGVSGEDDLPVLDGTLNVYANAYEDSIEALKGTFKKLVLNVIGEFYIRFKDTIIGNHFISKFGDGVGVTKAKLSAITNQQLGKTFMGNTEITSFNELQYLTELTEIVFEAFNGCSNLREVIIPQNVTFINYSAFRKTAIESIFIPKSVATIWQSAFQDCSNLKSVTFENGSQFNEMRWAIFNGCTSLEEIDLPDTITVKGNYNSNFTDCTSLRRCHYPTNDSITIMPGSEFKNCSSLQELPLTPYIKTIEIDAFNGCSSLTGHLDLSNITTMSGYRSFRSCTGIESVDLSGLVGALGPESFMLCSSLKSVVFGKSITSIGSFAFTNTAIESLDIFGHDGIVLGSSCFSNCLNLHTVRLPDSCTINQYVFSDCKSFDGILIITANTIIIGGGHFNRCSISELIIEEGQMEVTPSYNECRSLRFITLPSTIKKIIEIPFHSNNAIEWFICKAVIPPVMASNLGYIPHNWKLYVPDGSVDAYKAASGWSQYASKIYPLSSKPTE